MNTNAKTLEQPRATTDIKTSDKPRIKTSSKPPVREVLPCAYMVW